MQCADRAIPKRSACQRGATRRLAPRRLAPAIAALMVAVACMPAMAQGTGRATLSVGITIVAATPAVDHGTTPQNDGPRIPVDPAYAVDPTDPLRTARVERAASADGAPLQVVSY